MRVNLSVVGLGNVGRRFLELVEQKQALLRDRFDLELVIVGAADSGGGAEYYKGLDIAKILELKRSHKGVSAYPDHGRAELDIAEFVRATDVPDVLVELSPTNLKDGEPGMSAIRAALLRKVNVVTANKGPLVLAYQELMELARRNKVKLLHSATITGGLPTLNIGQRDLAACEFLRFEGIVNATTNYILSRMTEGESFDAALKHAQDVGHAEADPSLDVDGWDAANKLVLIANAVFHRPTRLKDVLVTGIRGVSPSDLKAASARNQVIKLVARAAKQDGDFVLTVKPEPLEKSHPLAGVSADMMGVLYETDINGTIFAAIEERDPYPTAAAVLRDVISIYNQP